MFDPFGSWLRLNQNEIAINDLFRYVRGCATLYINQEKHRATFDQTESRNVFFQTYTVLTEGSLDLPSYVEQVNQKNTSRNMDEDPDLWFLIRTYAKLRGRILFMTKGGLLGVGSVTIQRGDKVCVFFGGRSCYILRKHLDGAHWQFRYEAYVYGLMICQIFDKLSDGEA
jgi:hypothetical protein